MAALRNLAIGALRLTGCDNIAAGLRKHSREATRPLTTLGITCGNSADYLLARHHVPQLRGLDTPGDHARLAAEFMPFATTDLQCVVSAG
ncbi:hypothetical protein [Streptomyces sp. NPDC046859]|uniref:hypothetical protein n=1 Tax=Streptomyces sp. NPDC046859 TaxID=3155734 RepID=UPI0034035AE2